MGFKRSWVQIPPARDIYMLQVYRLTILGAVVLLWATPGGVRSSSNIGHTVSLNQRALDYARKLIAENHVVNDKRGEWARHQVSAAIETEFMQQHGSEEFARWHLGIDESHRADSKARYKFPFGDFRNVHRCALIAAQNRARQYGYADIEHAAKQLLDLIERKRSMAMQTGDFDEDN
jgi:hypothetical protein